MRGLFPRLTFSDQADALRTARWMAKMHQKPVGIFVREVADSIPGADSFVLWKAEVDPIDVDIRWKLARTIKPASDHAAKINTSRRRVKPTTEVR
jgi:hypothetical protein